MPQNFHVPPRSTSHPSDWDEPASEGVRCVPKHDNLMATLYYISKNRLPKLAEKHSTRKAEKWKWRVT